jgi:hypothetical protein
MRLAAFAWSLIALCQLTAQAQFDPDPPELSLRQMNALIRRSEALLRQGQALQALRVSEPVDSSLMSDAAISDSAYDEISVRTRSLRWTSIVRLGGAYTLAVERARDKREVLLAAEARLRELLKHDKPLYTARHAEALVALGDRMPEAYAALHALQEAGTLEEPESYAALAIAARTTDHADVQTSARAACTRLAKRRAKQLCSKL